MGPPRTDSGLASSRFQATPKELTAEFQLTYLIGQGSTEAIHFVHHERPGPIFHFFPRVPEHGLA
jgi:hypothetical protein